LIAPEAAITSEAVRTKLVEPRKLGLIGPWAGHAFGEEQLPGASLKASRSEGTGDLF
jgi:hypothetical protein